MKKYFSFILICLLPLQVFGAISADTSGKVGGTGTSATLSLILTSNSVLWANLSHGADETVSCSWNGSAMSSEARVFNQRSIEAFYHSSPDSGTHNLVCTWSTSGFYALTASSWVGVSSTGQPSVVNSSYEVAGASGSSITTLVTVPDDNSMLVGAGYTDSSVASSGGSNTTIDQDQVSAQMSVTALHSTALVSAGSQGLTLNEGGTNNYHTLIVASLSPEIDSSATSTATTTVATDVLGAISFQLAIIIVMIFLMVVGFLFNNMKQKRPWQG